MSCPLRLQPLKHTFARLRRHGTPIKLSAMKCTTKEDLQRNCTGAWDAYISAVGAPQAGTVLPPQYSGLAKLADKPEAFQDAVRLLDEHRKASRALSQHLSEHRC